MAFLQYGQQAWKCFFVLCFAEGNDSKLRFRLAWVVLDSLDEKRVFAELVRKCAMLSESDGSGQSGNGGAAAVEIEENGLGLICLGCAKDIRNPERIASVEQGEIVRFFLYQWDDGIAVADGRLPCPHAELPVVDEDSSCLVDGQSGPEGGLNVDVDGTDCDDGDQSDGEGCVAKSLAHVCYPGGLLRVLLVMGHPLAIRSIPP